VSDDDFIAMTDDHAEEDKAYSAILRLARHPREVTAACLDGLYDNAIDQLASADEDALAGAVDSDMAVARALGFLASLVVTLRQGQRYEELFEDKAVAP
jgi:hypothetical protein